MRGEPSSFEYAAFISYRHADNKEQGRQWATWLHTALEHYEVPADLVGTPSTHGSLVPSSLYPVFRDEEELPASACLTESLHRALERSRVLIVICSPRAVLSRYVEDEIRYFKELGRADAVLALIVEGKPKATIPGESVAPGECFPATLRMGGLRPDGELDWSLPASPVAADTRPAGGPGQGWTSAAAFRMALLRQGTPRADADRRAQDYGQRLSGALLKIIAGTLGVGLRELTQRDKARQLEQARKRVSRFQRLAAAFGILSLLAAAAGGYAWKKRTDEAAQRAAAEDLVGFMLTDMREKLAPLRRTDLLQSVTHGASRYFDHFPGDLKTTGAMRQRAALLAVLGDIHFDQDRLAEAEESYKSALLLREGLHLRFPADAAIRHDHWESLQQLGYIALKHRQLGPAAARFEKAAKVAGEDPLDYSLSLTALASVAEASGESDSALGLHLKSLDFRKQLAAASPGDPGRRRRVAMGHNDIGDVYLLRGEAEKADGHFQASHEIRAGLGKEGQGTAQERRDLSVSLNKLGTLHQKRGDLASAEKVFSETLAIRQQLVKEDPLSAQARRDLAASHHKLADVWTLQCQFRRAQESFEEALRIRRLLAGAEQSGADTRRVLGFNLDSLGRVLTLLGHPEDAERLHLESLDLARELANDTPENADAQRNLAVSLHRVAAVQFLLGKLTDARRDIQASLDLSHVLVSKDPGNLEGKNYHCEALETCCDIQIKSGDTGMARKALNEALAIRQEISRRTPGNECDRAMSMLLARAGAVACAMGNHPDAAGHFSGGRKLMDQQLSVQPGNPAVLHAHRQFTGHVTAALSSSGLEAEAEQFRRMAAEAERQAAEAGNPLSAK